MAAPFTRTNENTIEISGQRFEVAYPEKVIAEQVGGLAMTLAQQLDPNERVLLVGVLKGSVCFLPDLSRALEAANVPHEYNLLPVSSSGTSGSGVVRASKPMIPNIEGAQTVLLDVAEHTGLSGNFLRKNLAAQKPVSLISVTLFCAPGLIGSGIGPDLVGFEVPQALYPLVGYGMDIHEQGRQLPDVYGAVPN